MTDSHADHEILNLYSRTRLDDRAIMMTARPCKGIPKKTPVGGKKAAFPPVANRPS